MDAELFYMAYTGIWEYELFFSVNFKQHRVYKEHPARFEGESSKYLKKDFTISVKDIVCIIKLDMILHITQRGHLFYC